MIPGDTVSEPDASRAGSILRAEREALGVTVREVAETLNLSMDVIEALEADDYEHLPGLVFARGYVRAYARLLELEPEPLIAQYPRPQTQPLSPRRQRELPVREWIRRRPALVLGATAGVAGLLLVMLVSWVWPDGEPPADVALGSGTAGIEAGAGAPPEAAAGERSGDPTGTGVEGAAGGSLPELAAARGDLQGGADEHTGSVRGDGLDGAATEVLTGAAAEPAAGAQARRITDGGEDTLVFTFSDDCWVEVRDAAGRRLYSNLSRADSRLHLVGQAPFRILLGYAPGAQLSFNGEPVPLAPHTRDNVATLVLGQ